MQQVERDWDEAAIVGADAPMSVPPPDIQLEAEEALSRLRSALDTLPERCRLVMQLRWREQLSYQEIAEIVGRSLPSVKTDIHRARLEVRKKVKDYLKA